MTDRLGNIGQRYIVAVDSVNVNQDFTVSQKWQSTHSLTHLTSSSQLGQKATIKPRHFQPILSFALRFAPCYTHLLQLNPDHHCSPPGGFNWLTPLFLLSFGVHLMAATLNYQWVLKSRAALEILLVPNSWIRLFSRPKSCHYYHNITSKAIIKTFIRAAVLGI